MLTLILGIFINALVIFAILDKDTFGFYFQAHSFILVVGGTFGTLFLMTSKSGLLRLVSAIKSIRRPEESLLTYQNELVSLGKDKSVATTSKHLLIQYAIELWQQGIDSNLMVVLLSERRKELDSRSLASVQTTKHLAKYPPAFGMMGTVMGMITLFASLGEDKSNIGLSLSIAMTATFFGLFLTNLILSPLADRLHAMQMQETRLNENIYEVLLLINRGESSVLIREELHGRTG